MRQAALPYFSDLVAVLCEYKVKFGAAARSRFAETAITREVFGLLDYCLAQRATVLIEGDYRTGKSLAAQAWAQMHLGVCRYVQLSSAGDDTGFYRDIARALGVACSTQMKAADCGTARRKCSAASKFCCSLTNALTCYLRPLT